MLLTVAAVSAACTPGGRYGAHSTQRPFGVRVPVGASLSGVTTRQIPPSSVDPAESGPSDPNSVIMLDSSATPSSLLLVFLAGSGGRPGCCQMFLGAAAFSSAFTRSGAHLQQQPGRRSSLSERPAVLRRRS